MALIQHEYELSIWKDVWARPTVLDEDGNVITTVEGADVLDEEKSAILSTDNFDFPGKAINIIFKTKINGTHELTFDLPGKYIDPSTGKKTKNYLVGLTDNETKIKLYYKDKWYTFYVKKVTEKREKNIMQYSYSCTDSFIVELSKTGYKITFNEYTKHYIEEIHPFAEDILEGSEWQYNEQQTRNNCDLTEYQEEKLVAYRVSKSAILYQLDLDDTANQYSLYGTNNTYPANTPKPADYKEVITPTREIGNNYIEVYGFYSEFNKDVVDEYGQATGTPGAKIKQVIFVPNGRYDISGNTIINKRCQYIVKESDILSSDLTILALQKDHLYGDRVCYNSYTEYCKELDRYVKRYTNLYSTGPSDVYSYTKSRIMVPNIATNYVANSKDMVDTTGWAPQYATDKLKVGKTSSGSWELDERGLPKLTSTKTPNTYSIIGENLTVNSNCVRIINSGPFSKNLSIDTPTVFAFRMVYAWKKYQPTRWLTDTNDKVYAIGEDYTEPASTTHSVKVKICQPIVNLTGDSYYKEIVTEASALDDDGNYRLTYDNPLYTICERSGNITSGQYYLLNISNDMLVNNGGKLDNLFIVIEISAPSGLTAAFTVSDLEFFEAWTYDNKHTKGMPINNYLSKLMNPKYIVPSYPTGTTSTANFDIPNNGGLTYEWMQNYVNNLNAGQTNILSASSAYEEMMKQLEQWEAQYAGAEAKYTLVTERSIVSGKAFDEEMYFIIPDNQPLFGDPIVYYLDPEQDLAGLINTYNLQKWYVHTKYRTLKQEKSNRFNLTQQLSELFHVYPVYEIDYYKNGKVKKTLYGDDNTPVTVTYHADTDTYTTDKLVAYSRRNKYLYYTDSKGGENKYGFKYGHNLNSISRTLDSTDIVTKMFVTDNSNQYAKDGICSIARAIDNLGKDTYLLRFDYFINRGLISKERVDNDLYGTTIKRVYSFSDFTSDVVDNPYLEEISRYEGYTSDLIPDVTIYEGFLKTIGEINTRYDKITEEQALLEKHQLIVLEASVQTYTSAVKALREQLAKQKNLATAYEKEEANKKWKEYVDSCERIESKIETYEIYLISAQYMYEMYADLYNKYECEMHFLLYCKHKIEVYFNTRYENLLREGVWQDSKYLDDDSYYLDAEKVAVDSCSPKITYTISVTDLSVLENYHFADFNVGDITYVQDYEFFGDDPDSNDKYYEERTIVSVITCNLDNPSKNTISLQNYSTKFDDLFSRVTASVQSLTFNENIYQRAARFTPNGQVDSETLQDTLSNNDLTLVGNQDVKIDGNGILVTDLRIPSNQVKIIGSGVYLTANGGASWYGAFENGGINASLLTVGAINTKSITIINDDHSNFLWDENGITAYASVGLYNPNDKTKTGQNATSAATYVRFNQYGLYFVNGDASFDMMLEQHYNNENGLKKSDIPKYIMSNAAVAITYDGFSINGAQNKVRFTSDEGIVMYNENNEVVTQLGFVTGINGVNDFWGLRAQGAYVEGQLISERLYSRSVNAGGQTGKISVIDYSRAMLRGGQFQIWRTIREKNTVTEDDDPFNNAKQVTSFGSTLLKASGGLDPDDSNNGEQVGLSVDEYLNNIGSSIHIDKDGRFWSLSSYTQTQDGHTYKPKLLYAREDISGTSYQADNLYVRCNLVQKTASTTSDIRIKKNITDLDERYLQLFDNLSPKTYNLTSESDQAPKHIGLIAQEVGKECEKLGINLDETAIVDIPKDEKIATINYIELLTIAIAKIKQLENEIEKLKK